MWKGREERTYDQDLRMSSATSLPKLFSISLLMNSLGGLKSGVGIAEKRLLTRGLRVACAFQHPSFRVRSFSASIDVAIGMMPAIYTM